MEINLTELANFPDCKSEPRIVHPEGVLVSPGLVLKFYSMIKKEELPFTYGLVNLMKEFTSEEIKNNRIQPFSGLGFTILSKGILNIAKWDDKNPYLLRQDLYVYGIKEGQPDKIKKVSLDKEGTFCVYELGIVGHEKNAWLGFLASERREMDKQDYLQNTISGDI